MISGLAWALPATTFSLASLPNLVHTHILFKRFVACFCVRIIGRWQSEVDGWAWTRLVHDEEMLTKFLGTLDEDAKCVAMSPDCH